MTSSASSAEYILPIWKFDVRSATRRTGQGNTSRSWQAVADTASGIFFLGVLAWAIWHIGNELLQLGTQAVVATGSYLF